MNTFYSAKKH